jgi:transcriptional regulator with XRE-family HTH domain
MNDIDDYYNQKRAMGQRFKQFRELVGKSITEMEQEAKNPLIAKTRINLFEQGAIIPDIVFVQYFTHEYGLNLTWLVTGQGFIFTKKTPKTPENIYMILHDTEPDEQFINEIIRFNRQKNEIDFSKQKSNGRGDPAPTVTMRIYKAFKTIRDLFIPVKVGARSPRPLPGNRRQDDKVG